MILFLLCLLPLAQCGLVPGEPAAPIPLDGTGYQPINQDYYVPNEILKVGDKEDCHPVERTVYKDECVPYVEKTCFTQQKELCKDVFDKNCTAVIDEFEDRECFDVTELMCQLVENIQYEMVEETYTVQRCTRVTDRVCDTVYDLSVSTKDDFQCVDLEHQYCWDEDKVVKDRTCIFSVDFDCGKHKDQDGKGAVKCEKVPTKKCYDTPRKVHEEYCKPRSSRYCEKFTNEFPFPVEKQNCHTEPMKRCELETRSRPKKAKQYTYFKDCKPVTRKVCDNVEKKLLKPVCDQVQRKVCSYVPEEKCEEEKKQYCFKSEKIIIDKVCVGEKKDVHEDSFSYV